MCANCSKSSRRSSPRVDASDSYDDDALDDVLDDAFARVVTARRPLRVTVGAKTPRRRSSSSDVSNRRHVARDARDDPRDDADDENASLARRPHRASARVAIPRVARCR
jgi:hypothetical protein